jgi:uncharacterized repeat protein (TIGR01451 family)
VEVKAAMGRWGRRLAPALLLAALLGAAAGCHGPSPTPDASRNPDPFFSSLSPTGRGPDAPPVPPAGDGGARPDGGGTGRLSSVYLSVAGPSSAGVGQEVAYALTIHNTDTTATRALMVRSTLPENLKYVRSEPPAMSEDGQLVWTLGALDGRSDRTLQVVFQAARPGQLTLRAGLVTDEGQRDERSATTEITTPQSPELRASLTGPTSGVVGVPLTCQVTVTNPGTGALTKIMLSADFDAGLEHESRVHPVELPLGSLAAGESKPVPLTLRPLRPGSAGIRVTATADGGLFSRAEHVVTVQEAKLTLHLNGPAVRYVGRPAVWEVDVTNAGAVPLAQVTVRDLLPPELEFASATEGGRLQNAGRHPAKGEPPSALSREVAWDLGALKPGEQKRLQLTTTPTRMAEKALNVVLASAVPEGAGTTAGKGHLQAEAEAALSIQGLPAFKLAVVDLDDPVEVGARTSYKITVTNTGSLPGSGVQVAAVLPQQMRLVAASGRSPYHAEGPRVVFEPLASLEPGQAVTCTIEVEAMQAGDARFRAELTSATLREPIIKEESTNVVGGETHQPASPASR